MVLTLLFVFSVKRRIAQIQRHIDQHHCDVREVEPDGISPDAGFAPFDQLAEQANQIAVLFFIVKTLSISYCNKP